MREIPGKTGEMQQQALEAKQLEKEQDAIEMEKDRQKDIEIALIKAEASKDQEANSLNLEKMIKDFEFKNRELDIKEQELSEKVRGSQAQEDNMKEANQVKREDILNKLDIAKQNARQRD